MSDHHGCGGGSVGRENCMLVESCDIPIFGGK